MSPRRTWKKVGEEWQDVLLDVITYVRWAVTSAVDGGFLLFWIVFQWYFSEQWTKGLLPLSDVVDQVQLWVIRILFAILTLAPIVAHMVMVLTKIGLQVRDEIRERVNERVRTDDA